jgi:hypothetical protein
MSILNLPPMQPILRPVDTVLNFGIHAYHAWTTPIHTGRAWINLVHVPILSVLYY